MFHPSSRVRIGAPALASMLLLASTTVTLAASSRTVHVLLDVRAEWGRTLSGCVTEGVFFGFHSGTAVVVDQGADVIHPEDVAGVWWWQTDTCEPVNSFFVTGDVALEPADFEIDRRLGSASVDVEVPVVLDGVTYTFAFDLAYAATSSPMVGVAHDDGFVREDRLAPAELSGVIASDIPGGFAGFTLSWADIGSLTQIQSGG